MNQTSITEVASQIEPRLTLYLPQLGINTTSVSICIRRISSHFLRKLFPFNPSPSEVFMAIIATTRPTSTVRRMYVKIHKDNRVAAQEFRNLRLLWARFKQSNEFRISKPIDHIGKLNAVITAGVDGSHLSTLIRWGRIFPHSRDEIQTLVSYVERTGTWLTYLHGIKVEHNSLRSLNRTRIRDELESLMKEARVEGLPQSLISNARSKFDKVIESVGGMRSVLVHSDFTPEHVFVNEHAISVIDFELLRFGPAVLDIARFCSYFDLMLMQLNMGPISQWLRSKFISAASSQCGSDVRELVDAFVTMMMLRKWIEVKHRLQISHDPKLYAFLPYVAKRALTVVRNICSET